MRFLVFLFVFCVTHTHARQVPDSSKSEHKVLANDSTMAVGVSRGCFGTKDVTYCSLRSDKYIPSGKAVVIRGMKHCKSGYTVEHLFEVIYNNKIYFVPSLDIATDETYYDQLERMPADALARFRAYADHIGQIVYESDVLKVLTFLESCKPKGLSVVKWSFHDESEYTSGKGVEVSVYNPTGKTIKYLWFTLVGYNPVGDKVVDPKRKTSNVTLKGVGPIAPDETSSYTFSYAWFTDLVSTAKMLSIKVQYMDGTFKTISAPGSITLSEDLYRIIED